MFDICYDLFHIIVVNRISSYYNYWKNVSYACENDVHVWLSIVQFTLNTDIHAKYYIFEHVNNYLILNLKLNKLYYSIEHENLFYYFY